MSRRIKPDRDIALIDEGRMISRPMDCTTDVRCRLLHLEMILMILLKKPFRKGWRQHNHFELALAVTIAPFGLASPMALTTVLGPVVAVPVWIVLLKGRSDSRKKYSQYLNRV